MNWSSAVAEHGTVARAARVLGIPRTTLASRLDKERRTAGASAVTPENRLTFPALPDAREPLEELIERRTRHYLRGKTAKEAATWQRVHVRDDKPIGVCLIGDPHIDSDGCNWIRLKSDVEIMRDTDGMYGLNIGDTTNNWVGRLARLFGDQETSQTSARQLAEWLLVGAGVRWLAVILGNHCGWNEGGEIIRRMVSIAREPIPVHDWSAKIELVFPNGATCRINAAHDFKGRSIYSTTHGPAKEAIWFQDKANLLVSGHIHFGGLQQIELPGGHNPWLVRVGSYKENDHYALVNGFHEGRRFPSVVAIIDPNAPEEDRVSVFGSVRQGAEVLKAMRSSWSKTPKKRARSGDVCKPRARLQNSKTSARSRRKKRRRAQIKT